MIVVSRPIWRRVGDELEVLEDVMPERMTSKNPANNLLPRGQGVRKTPSPKTLLRGGGQSEPNHAFDVWIGWRVDGGVVTFW